MKTNKSWFSSLSNKNLELIILVTEQCNFRCVYCYEDFKIGKISFDVIEGIKNLINNRINEIETLSLSFFGGEPLLNKNTVLEISNWAKELCYQNKVQYYASITTNGYSLDENIFKKLIESKTNSFQITLDGEKEEHDKLRPTINGKSTFIKIYENIKLMALSSEKFICTIRFNIADTNFNSIKSFIENDSKPFANDKRFKFHFHPIFGMEKLKLTRDKQLQELEDIAKTRGILLDSVSDEPSSCYAAKANSYVIRADGRVQKCTVALESEINNIGKIHKDGTLEINDDKLKKWIFAENKECPVQSLALEKLIIPYEKAGKFSKSS